MVSTVRIKDIVVMIKVWDDHFAGKLERWDVEEDDAVGLPGHGDHAVPRVEGCRVQLCSI